MKFVLCVNQILEGFIHIHLQDNKHTEDTVVKVSFKT